MLGKRSTSVQGLCNFCCIFSLTKFGLISWKLLVINLNFFVLLLGYKERNILDQNWFFKITIEKLTNWQFLSNSGPCTICNDHLFSFFAILIFVNSPPNLQTEYWTSKRRAPALFPIWRKAQQTQSICIWQNTCIPSAHFPRPEMQVAAVLNHPAHTWWSRAASPRLSTLHTSPGTLGSSCGLACLQVPILLISTVGDIKYTHVATSIYLLERHTVLISTQVLLPPPL